MVYRGSSRLQWVYHLVHLGLRRNHYELSHFKVEKAEEDKSHPMNSSQPEK